MRISAKLTQASCSNGMNTSLVPKQVDTTLIHRKDMTFSYFFKSM